MTNTFAYRWIIVLIATIFLAGTITLPVRLEAQTGYNAIYSGGVTVASSSFIDASAFTGADICAKINSVLKWASYPAVGTVIDTRGIRSGTSQSCANSPWNGITTPPPSVILLPSGTITIPATWLLPDRTRIFGIERSDPGVSGTILQAGTSFATGTAMIQMGDSTCESSSGICFGIAVQDLMLYGANQNIIGILNQHSQEMSYVQRVNFHEILGTGLEVSGSQAQNSGPYSDLACSTGSSYTSSTVCYDFNGVGGTRGIHGFTATASSGSGTGPTAGLLLDSENNTVEDGHFEGFQDGILIGQNANANTNSIFNITGGTGTGPMTNLVEISSANQAYGINLMSLNNGGATNTIKDDETSTTLSETFVGTYFLGNPLAGGYSRFTTSKFATAWGVGSSAPTSGCTTGSLFSNTSGTSSGSDTLYVCIGGNWTNIK